MSEFRQIYLRIQVFMGWYVREQHFSFLFAQTFLRPAHVKLRKLEKTFLRVYSKTLEKSVTIIR
ncbi:hypothetical protein LEP1GSC043_3427 [Leptospira weilii str. Ecochallenge]|uniref:Uncharacterized protein n=3 Tax=Leptospira weilii TaxID=28184 RepID=N1UA32_9LEPT|nr:hypothetical protein LEP1GSC043_3427 [Leptospira weilii str. Ecochallenge]